MSDLHGKLSVKRLYGLVNIGEGRPRGDLQAKTITPTRSQQVVTPDSEYYGLSHVTVEAVTLQDKTVTPGTSTQVVEPDDGSTGLGTVTVLAAPLQQKTVVPAVQAQEVTPDAGYYGLEKVTVAETPLQAITITPSYEKQYIVPDDEHIGFSSITVGAMEDIGGGSGGGGDNYGSADDLPFGDEYTDGDVPTGDYDYTDDGDYIPGIPDGDHQVLFDTELKETTTLSFRAEFLWEPNNTVLGGYGEFDYQIVTTMPCRGYIVKGTLIYGKPPYSYCHQASLWLAFTGQVGTIKVKETTAENWSDYGGDGVATATGTFKEVNMSFNTTEDHPDNTWVVSGAPCFDVGIFSGSTKEEVENAYHNAAAAIFDSYESGEIQQYVAVVSESQIRSDGSVINNVDGSSMSIYELDTKGDNTWKLVGTTDGRDYLVQSFTPVWNSGEILDMSGESVIQNPSADPVPEMTGGMVANPLDRNETYTIEGNSLNALVGAAQKVVGSTEPMTPTQAATALEDYYNQPKAEEVLW